MKRCPVRNSAPKPSAGAALTLGLVFWAVFGGHSDAAAQDQAEAHKPELQRSQVIDQIAGQVGILSRVDTQALCTGFCVAPSLIATAGHCVPKHKLHHTQRSKRIRFRLIGPAGTNKSTRVHKIEARGASALFRAPIQVGGDWALLRLANPVCARGELPLAARQATILEPSTGPMFIANLLPRNGAGRKLSLTPCAQIKRDQKTEQDFRDADHLIFHDCPVTAGASGAPLVTVDASGRVRLLAMQVGIYARSVVRTSGSGAVHRTRRRPIAHIAIKASRIQSIKE